MKLGLLAHAPHPGALRYGAHFGSVRSSGAFNWHARMILGDALANDRFGCCVPAGFHRLAQMRMANAWGSSWRPTGAQVLGAYREWTGFDPATGQPDSGTDVAVAQAALARTGLDLGLQAPDVALPVVLDHSNPAELEHAADVLGGIGLCLNMPAEWQTAAAWDVAGAPGAWGAHFVVSGRREAGAWVVITWGQEIELTDAALAKYCLGAVAGASRSWLDATGRTPDGMNWGALVASV